ncbi:hypothetical protein [Gelidibacter mesophilus]|uniref:hypothetical protein n=1 Tax=Gelidibacter mesophilus TaxID=169050 RepID=UPI000685A155|nr:hypothetical protein [Gelidibacter mesophilus]
MKIKYPKKRLRFQLIQACIWLSFGVLGFVFDTSLVFTIGYLILGLLHMVHYVFEKSKQYLTIDNGILTRNKLTPKSINLNKLIQIKKIAGDYLLRTHHDELRINTAFIEKSSLIELDKMLDQINLIDEIPLDMQSSPP